MKKHIWKHYRHATVNPTGLASTWICKSVPDNVYVGQILKYDNTPEYVVHKKDVKSGEKFSKLRDCVRYVLLGILPPPVVTIQPKQEQVLQSAKSEYDDADAWECYYG